LPHYERVEGDRTGTVTVLFTDLVASTQLRSRLGDLAADARLCHAAAGGEVLVADVVRVLAGSRTPHRFEPRGALELAGLPARPREKTP
jgi:class 3 adenylate cyclase